MDKDTEKKISAFPDSIKEGLSASIPFRITEEMVAGFSELTGDKSPLHTERDFARRSIYRQQVVHGMLPLVFISLLDTFQEDSFLCSIVELSVQFIEPVFINDKLSLNAVVTEANREDARIKFNYTIENEDSKAVLSKGAITADYHQVKVKDHVLSHGTLSDSHSMLCQALTARDLKLEDISQDQTDDFRFMITERSITGFLEVLLAGVQKRERLNLTTLPLKFYFPNYLAIMLFSTSVGMGIPGRYATFLEFMAKVDRTIKINIPYLLKGKVTHISQSTRIIKKEITVSDMDNLQYTPISGKASVLVNTPPSRMPSLHSIRENELSMGIRDKVVLITGSSRGIGETTAKLFALHGARVVVNYFRGETDAERIVDEIVNAGGDAIAICADVSDPLQVQEMVRRAVEKYQTINILVNNAARDFRPRSFLKLSWDDVQKDMDIIVKGTFNCCKEVIPLMIKEGVGKIINISTVATDNPPPNQAKYVIAKSAIVGLTRALAVEFAAKNIQVNMVVPNFVETDLVSHIPEAYRKKIAQQTPMQRNASPVDVAHAVLFMASSYSSFTTGQRIMVTGGSVPYL